MTLSVEYPTDLVRSFAESFGDHPSWSPHEMEELDRFIREAAGAAQEYWPELEQPAEQFAAYLGSRVDESSTALSSLGGLQLCDLYLACACAHGDPKAITMFDRAFSTEIYQAIAHLKQPKDMADEIRQSVHAKLFVAEAGERRKIADYNGRGPLARWLYVTATREALMMMRKVRRETALEDRHLGIASDDVELDFLRREYRKEFSQSLEEAAAALSSRQSNLLYYHYVEQLNIDQIAVIYGVHRTTAFRWLREARAAVVRLTRKSLAARIRVDEDELDSIMKQVQSRLDVSVEKILRAAR